MSDTVSLIVGGLIGLGIGATLIIGRQLLWERNWRRKNERS